MKIPVFILLFITTLVYAGSSLTAGYIAKAYKGAHLGKVIVKSIDHSMAMQKYIEDGFTEELNDYNAVQASAFMEKLPPSNTYTDEESMQKLLANGFEKIIIIEKQSTFKQHVKATDLPGVFSMTEIVYEIKVLDLKNNNSLVWIGDIFVFRDSTVKDTREHLQRHIVKLMKRDGLVK